MAYYLKRKLIDEPYWYHLRAGCSRGENPCRAPYSHNSWPRLEKGKIKVWSQASASQVETFDKCERAWWFKSVKRLPDPQKQHQALGSALHRIVEVVPQGLTYHPSDVPAANQEQWTKAKRLADEVIKIIPPHITHRETQINLDTWEGGPNFIGYTDIGIRPGLGWEQLLIPADPKAGIIGDYKTLSDFKYIKTPAELADSVQMMSYAKWAITAPGLVRWDEEPPDTVYLAHVYALTREPITQKSVRHSVACVTAEQIEDKWQNTLDKIRRMSKIAISASDHNQVEATGALTGHCQAYGGCPFRDQCGLAPGGSSIGKLFQITTKPKTESQNMSTPGAGSALLERIKAAKAKAAAEAGNAPTTETPTTSPPANTTSPAATATPANGGGSPAPAGATVHGVASQATVQSAGNTQVASAPPVVAATPAKPVQPATISTGVVPPDAPPRDQHPSTITTPGNPQVSTNTPAPAPQAVSNSNPTGPAAATAVPAGVGGTQASQGPATSGQTVANPQTNPQPVDNSPRRGRPTKAEMEAKKAAEDAAFNARVDAEVEKRLATMGVTMAQGPISATDEEIAAELTKLIEERDQAASALAEVKNAYQAKIREANDLHDQIKRVQDSGTTVMMPAADEGFTLYVDCLPVKGTEGAVDYYDWQAPIAARAAEMAEVPDWRLVNYTSRGVLAIAMREHIKANGVPKGAILIRSNVSGSDIAMEILTPLARRVVTSYR